VTRVSPRGQYRTAARLCNTVASAGITPRDEADQLLSTTHVGPGGLTVERGAELAAIAARRAVAACQAEIGDEGRLTAAHTLTVYIRSQEGFTEHTRVADGASSAIQNLLPGPAPARAAIGVSTLPGGAPLELQLSCAWEPA
jgi:enamine deaminase RidA (YjgF/YER057c/UK114 family)